MYVGIELLVRGERSPAAAALARRRREDGVDEIDRVERFGRERVASVLSSSFSVLM
jgi:hypothetical protein